MAEIIQRRFSRALAEGEALPDLVLVDGGITQLRAARAELDALGLPHQRVAVSPNSLRSCIMTRPMSRRRCGLRQIRRRCAFCSKFGTKRTGLR